MLNRINFQIIIFQTIKSCIKFETKYIKQVSLNIFRLENKPKTFEKKIIISNIKARIKINKSTQFTYYICVYTDF